MIRITKESELPFYTFYKLKRPVLSPGPKGSWDDEVVVDPRIIRFNNDYYNFYTGYTSCGTKWGIGLAKSKDLLTWEKVLPSPVIHSGNKDDWNYANVDGAWPFKLKNNFLLFFEGRRLFNTYETQSVGLAFSDGYNLTKWNCYEKNPVFTPSKREKEFDSIGILAPVVYRIRDIYYMFYGGFDGEKIRTGLAFSKDLINWTRYKNNPILDVGPNYRWDSHSSILINIFCVGKVFYGFFEGADEKERISVGIASSIDLIHWKKLTDSPVLTRGEKGGIDFKKVCSPYNIIANKRIYLFYGAHAEGERPGHTCVALANLKEWAQDAFTCFYDIYLT